MREIKNECLGGGNTLCLPPRERNRGRFRCGYCGKILKIKRGTGGFPVDLARIPRHSEPAPPRCKKCRRFL